MNQNGKHGMDQLEYVKNVARRTEAFRKQIRSDRGQSSRQELRVGRRRVGFATFGVSLLAETADWPSASRVGHATAVVEITVELLPRMTRGAGTRLELGSDAHLSSKAELLRNDKDSTQRSRLRAPVRVPCSSNGK